MRGVPESRSTPVSPEEGHPQKAPISPSSSFCYRNWALVKQTKNKPNPPDLKCLSRNRTKPQSVIVPMTGLEQCQQQSYKTQCLGPWSAANSENREARNVALSASGTHRGSLGPFDLVLSLQTCFCLCP